MYRIDAPETTIMQRIHMMWFYISDCGAKFQKKEYKLLQNVRRIMRESHEAIGESKDSMRVLESERLMSEIKGVLSEPLMAATPPPGSGGRSSSASGRRY